MSWWKKSMMLPKHYKSHVISGSFLPFTPYFSSFFIHCVPQHNFYFLLFSPFIPPPSFFIFPPIALSFQLGQLWLVYNVFPLFREAASCLQSCGRKYRSDPSSLPSCLQNQNRTFFRHQRPGFWPCRQPGCSLIICSCSPSTARMEDKSELEVIDYTLSCLCFLVDNIPGKSWSESLQCCECQRPSIFRRLSREWTLIFQIGATRLLMSKDNFGRSWWNG